LDGEGSVLGLNGEGGMSSLSAFAAGGLADLVVLGVGDGSQLLDLSGFNVLLVALAETGSEAWELLEVAGASHIEGWEAQVLRTEVATHFSCARGGISTEVLTSIEVDNLRLSEVLGSLLTEAGLKGVLGCSSDDTSEEGEEDDLH